MRRGSGKRLRPAALLPALAAATAAYAFTASNTLGASTAGSGLNGISGYTASSIGYVLDPADPTKIDAVSFTLAPAAAAQVKVRLATGGAWYSCTNAGGSVSCPTTSPQATLAAADTVAVVASA